MGGGPKPGRDSFSEKLAGEHLIGYSTRVRRYLKYWLANMAKTYEIATRHGNVLGFIAPLASVIVFVVGASVLTTSRTASAVGGIGVGLLLYFVAIMLFVTPAIMWHDLHCKIEPKLAFIDHPDNTAFDRLNFCMHERVTVKNLNAAAGLTDVEVIMTDIVPRPADFMTIMVPMHPMHATTDQGTKFNLPPLGHRTVDVLDADTNPGFSLWHAVAAVPNHVPDGSYVLRLTAYAKETVPADLEVELGVTRTDTSTQFTFNRRSLSSG